MDISGKTVLCFGDSWTGGHEMCPDSQEDDYFHPEHVAYRQSGTWPSFMDAKNVVNLGMPGCSNDQMLREVIEYVTDHYVNDGVVDDDLFVIVGWSSPCRKEIIYMDDIAAKAIRSTLWPSTVPGHKYPTPMYEMHRLHMLYFWSEEEIFNRYVHHNLYLQNFLKGMGIPFLAYNAFYEFNTYGDEETMASSRGFFNKFKAQIFNDNSGTMNDTRYFSNLESLNSLRNIFTEDIKLWRKLIDDCSYYHKHDFSRSYMACIGDRIHDKKYFDDFHPTALMHREWAGIITEYINDAAG